MKFAYTNPDGWNTRTWEGNPRAMVEKLRSACSTTIRSQFPDEPTQIVLTLDAEPINDAQAIEALEAGKSIRCQIMVGGAFGPVCDAQELEAHKAYKEAGQKSLNRICQQTGTDYETR